MVLTIYLIKTCDNFQTSEAQKRSNISKQIFILISGMPFHVCEV